MDRSYRLQRWATPFDWLTGSGLNACPVGRAKFCLGINRFHEVLEDLEAEVEQQLNLIDGRRTVPQGHQADGPLVTRVTPNCGPERGNTRVVLEGRGFGEATQVEFGKSPAVGFTVVDDRTIAALTPPAEPDTGTVQVRITTLSARSIQNPPNNQFTFTRQVLP